MLTVRILAQGDEILTGATLDTNSQWLAGELFARGARVVGLAAAPDDLALLTRLIAAAAAGADLVVSAGGLGPTDDDLTAQAAAAAAGVDLALDPVALAQVEARFRAIGRPMAASNRKQALLPRGAEVLENTAGSAPGFALTLAGARVLFFPGVPRELKVMAERHLFPYLAATGAGAILRKRFHVCGVGESVLQDRLKDLALPAAVRIGYKTWLPYNTVVLYAEPAPAGAGSGLDPAEARLQAAAGLVRERLGSDVFGEDDESLGSAVGAALSARGLTVAVAESCTAGIAGALLTEPAGSSRWFRGGVIAYADEVKTGLLGVPALTLAGDGAVSEAAARAMAAGVRRLTGAAIGVAVTGIAGPGGGSAEKPVGLVCFAIEGPRGALSWSTRFGGHGRDGVRALAAAHAVERLRRALVAAPPED